MSFDNIESSRALGEPVSLYHFQYGDLANQAFAYTNAETAITHAGVTYSPAPIVMGAVRSSGSLDKQAIEIRTSKNTQLADLFRIFPPSQVVTIIVRQGHLEDPSNQFLVTWSGRVVSHKIEENEAIYTVESAATAMQRSILRRHYMLGCAHALYGPQCKASKTAATITRPVLTASGSYVTLLDTWETEPRKSKYVGGLAEWTSAAGVKESRWLIKVTGTNNEKILLGGVAKGIVAGTQISLSLGCNHQAGLDDDCIVLHNNILNFGGQPWIPTINPIGLKNTFY